MVEPIDPKNTPSETPSHNFSASNSTGETIDHASDHGSTPTAHTPHSEHASETEHAGDHLPTGQIWTPFEEATPLPKRHELVELDASDDGHEIEAAVTDNSEIDSDDTLEEVEEIEETDDATVEGDALEEGAEVTEVVEGVEGSTQDVTADGAPAKPVRRVVKRREAPKARDTIMVVNEVPGDECRVAFVRGRRLESYFAERVTSATNVGNIYKGRVTNVEAAIQAAFIDFGEGQNGFLHISDLHPKYFPGGIKAESVGHKIPRHDRPAIQDCVKKGQEITVQVIKQGIGTKGPTLTSYVSVPGRLLVMMPDMDKVGVSRKVEDEQQRREMRKILDSLELPEGFGFILRTAGFDRSRTELQRDAAYLQRLWQAMAKRINSVGAPAELYTESDILLRTVREMVDETVSHIIVDNEAAWQRVTAFLEVVFAKDAPKVLFYDRPAPIFSAFDLDRQIDGIHSREVPLPSGGALWTSHLAMPFSL